MFKCLYNKKGFGIVEIMIAVAIAIVFFLTVYELILFSTKVTFTGLRRVEATQLAQEGIEAVRTMRNNGWTANIASLANSTTYYLLISGDEWTLTATPQPAINGIFTRTVTLHEVLRDANDDIAVAGTADTKTKRLVVSVSWDERGNTKNIDLETYITDFLAN